MISSIRFLITKIILKMNYLLNNYKDVVWLIGDGRSGTTWVASIINHDNRYREMFEPFHPKLIDDMKPLLPHQYLRVDASDECIQKISHDVFTGKFTHSRVDSQNNSLTYKGLLIKDIFANLFAFWATNNFSQLKTILLIRNPFAVALSKQKKKHWLWTNDPMELLNQRELFEDYLHPFEDQIREICGKNNYILSQILIWSIINYVPLRQFNSKQLHVVFYEDMFASPHEELTKILRFIDPGKLNSSLTLDSEVVDQPSRVCGDDSNILSGTSPVTTWRTELKEDEIDAGMEILKIFGLEELYDESGIPDRNVVNKFLV